MVDVPETGPGPEEFTEEEQLLQKMGLALELNRRRFVQTAGAFSALAATGLSSRAFADEVDSVPPQQVVLKVNGTPHKLMIDPRTSLLDALRDQMDLTGTKKGCDHGQCGACTVLVDGRRVNSCLTLAMAAQEAEITTIEGLAKNAAPKEMADLHPMQAAFLEHDGYQCGYCTPGQICSAVGAVAEHKRGTISIVSFGSGKTDNPELTDDEIRERMSGNICRCGAYPNIVAAVRSVARGESA